MSRVLKPTRREFLQGSVAAVGAVGLAASPFRSAASADFPSRNMSVYIPTAEGGGADRNFRAFAGVWKKYLETNFEGAYYPGASGRVGYEKYMGLASDDCHDLLFGNMGPEVLNWVVEPPTFDLADLIYFAQLDSDPGILFVAADSKLQSIDDIIAEGKKRSLNVAVSRLAHPASLGALAVARHTGVKFNLVPLGGGRNTLAGVSTGEMDFGALPSGNIVQRADTFKTVLVFDDKNPLGERLHNAPTANEHLGMDLPPLVAGARAFAIKKAAIDKYPDRFKTLQNTILEVFKDPDYKEAVIKTGAAWEYIGYGDMDACAKYVSNITRIGTEFKDLLTGKS